MSIPDLIAIVVTSFLATWFALWSRYWRKQSNAVHDLLHQALGDLFASRRRVEELEAECTRLTCELSKVEKVAEAKAAVAAASVKREPVKARSAGEVRRAVEQRNLEELADGDTAAE